MTTRRITGDWLRAPTTQRLMTALGAEGATARFVGGCVRDSLAGRPVCDIDIAIDARPEEVLALLERAEIRAIPTGLHHGTVTAAIDGTSFEITSLREDTACDGRHAQVVYTQDWEKDAQRRDFTINALYADADGVAHDFTGAGLTDLAERRVCFIGAPEDRIREDYLRILRLFRFHAWYGEDPMDPAALVACAGLAGGMVGLSRERIGAETLKLLAAPNIVHVVDMMEQTGVLAQILPHAPAKTPMAALHAAERRCAASPDAIRRLAFLTRRADCAQTVRALRLSNEQARALHARRPFGRLVESAADSRRLGYERGLAPGRDELIMQGAEGGPGATTPFLTAMADGAAQKLPVAAADMMAAGVDPGPRLGAALEAAESAWIESDFTLDKASLVEIALLRLPA